MDAKGQKRVVHEGLEFPNGLALSPAQSLLAVADSRSRWVWSFHIGPDGSLLNGQPFYRLEMTDEGTNPAADGVTVDGEGYLYVATRLGLQVFDQPGRLTAIITSRTRAHSPTRRSAGPTSTRSTSPPRTRCSAASSAARASGRGRRSSFPSHGSSASSYL